MNKSIAKYLLYHPSSNLIVLTVENFSETSNTATVDLSKAEMGNMALLTSHNKEENYSNKIDIEIDEYKGTPLTDRKWSVRLEPH
jgi:cell division protein FtsI/penicillin-binding protein 2